MQNKQQYLNGIKQTITYKAFDHGPADTAEVITRLIDDSYYLILKGDLPTIKIKPFTGNAELPHILESASKGDPAMMRTLAYEYLVMADHIDSKIRDKEDKKLHADRTKAWNLLHVHAYLQPDQWEWETISESDKQAVTVVVDLQRQLDNQ